MMQSEFDLYRVKIHSWGVVVCNLESPIPALLAPRRAPTLTKPGVYAIINSVNGKRYIGSASRTIAIRRNQHRHELRRGDHDNDYLQKAWNKYGESTFNFTPLLNCAPEWCLCLEQINIQAINATNRSVGYNLSKTAGSTLGMKHSAESRAKMSAHQKGKSRPLSPEAKAARSAKLKGKMRSPLICAKISAGIRSNYTQERRDAVSRMNRARTPEQLAAIKAAAQTPEAKERQRAAYRANPLPLSILREISKIRWAGDARARMSAALTGKKKSAAHIAALREAWKKRGPVPQWAKDKMRASRLAYLEKIKNGQD